MLSVRLEDCYGLRLGCPSIILEFSHLWDLLLQTLTYVKGVTALCCTTKMSWWFTCDLTNDLAVT